MCSVYTPLSFISVHENAANIKDLDKKRTIRIYTRSRKFRSTLVFIMRYQRQRVPMWDFLYNFIYSRKPYYIIQVLSLMNSLRVLSIKRVLKDFSPTQLCPDHQNCLLSLTLLNGQKCRLSSVYIPKDNNSIPNF